MVVVNKFGQAPFQLDWRFYFALKRVMNMTFKLGDQLSNKEKNHLNKVKKKKRKEEKVDWAEIMGTNRDTYRRGKGGAIRRK